MTYEVQQNRWDQLIRRSSGSIGPGSRVGETLAELFPVLEVENDRAELMLLAGWQLAQGARRLLASAGDRNHIQLFNPVGSGKLLVLERIDFTDNLDLRIEYTWTTTPLPDDGGNVVFRDTRLGVSGAPAGLLLTSQEPGGLPTIGLFQLINGVNFTFTHPGGISVIAPGTGMEFATDSVNSITNFNVMWRERVALQAELQF